MGGGSEGSFMAWPHLLQKLLSGGCVEPQFGHDISDSVDEPHVLQNLESSGFSVWHFGHFMIDASTMYFPNENMHGKAIN